MLKELSKNRLENENLVTVPVPWPISESGAYRLQVTPYQFFVSVFTTMT